MPATLETLKTIRPGVNYPTFVNVVEPNGYEVRFLLQSYFVGMYCAIHINKAAIPAQVGDHNNKTFVTKLKRDLEAALARGAQVEIGPLFPIKTDL
jgi:hypothetical protein